MGYSIYYNRAFIRVGDRYIPLVCSGASNGAERAGGRWVPEKDWGVLNWKRRGRVLFSEAEIRDIARDYERNHQENGMSFKSRSKPFAPGEFERWIIGGMKRAHTIEEYRSAGNAINVVDYPNGMIGRWRRQPFSSDGELLDIIKQFGAGHEFDISFGNKREVKRPAPNKTQKQAAMPSGIAPFSAVFGVKDAVPAAGRPEGGKPSVLGRIAEAREGQRRARAEVCEKDAPGTDRPTRGRGEEL